MYVFNAFLILPSAMNHFTFSLSLYFILFSFNPLPSSLSHPPSLFFILSSATFPNSPLLLSLSLPFFHVLIHPLFQPSRFPFLPIFPLFPFDPLALSASLPPFLPPAPSIPPIPTPSVPHLLSYFLSSILLSLLLLFHSFIIILFVSFVHSFLFKFASTNPLRSYSLHQFGKGSSRQI